MSVLNRDIEFLPKNAQIVVIVNPSGDFDKTLKRYFISINNVSNVDIIKTQSFISICLNEPLFIRFSISKSGNIHKKLKPCRCSTPVLSNESLKSLNSAYQRISQLFEKERSWHGGKVYDNVLFKDNDGYWKLLEVLRERVYQDYQEEFENRQRIIKDKFDNSPKRLDNNDKLELHAQMIIEVNNILQLKNIDLQQQVQQLNDLLDKSKLTAYKNKLQEFRERLEKDYPEASGNDSWQEWIYKNNWLFGIQYGMPIGHPQVGFKSILDYLFPTPDGFVDILEIKKPSHAVIKEDKSHPGAFRWSGEVNEAIGQVIKYLSEIELHQLIIAQKLKQELSLELSTIKPRAFILIGKSDDWSDTKKEAFRRLNHSLHGIEVLTYTDLLRRGENLINVYAD
ncbi:hypothetical protein CAL7716_101070 (plasmid) [Calothrix sp. PCC 7716]|nr:hypothetical protein CAL7716_101070 [Calothrix sp. PCC 7716]